MIITRDQEQLIVSVIYVQRVARRIKYLTKTRPDRTATKMQASRGLQLRFLWINPTAAVS